MYQPISLKIVNQTYPKENQHIAGVVQVENIQNFYSSRDLQNKKIQAFEIATLLNQNYVIKLKQVYKKQMSLHYIYEYVPYSIAQYIHQIAKNCKEFDYEIKINKNISFELTRLLSYLASIKVEVDFTYHNLRMTEAGKIKIYVDAKCKIGRKDEIKLLGYYTQCKKQILNAVWQQLSTINETLQFDYISNNNSKKFNVNQKKGSRINQNYISRRLSFNQKTDSELFQEIVNSSTRKSSDQIFDTKYRNFRHQKETPKHKFNFKFGNANKKAQRNQKQQDKNEDTTRNDQPQIQLFNESKQVKVKLSQNKRTRKDSLKVCITTTRQYQMLEDGVKQFFNVSDLNNLNQNQKQFNASKQFTADKKDQNKRTTNTQVNIGTYIPQNNLYLSLSLRVLQIKKRAQEAVKNLRSYGNK